jgi:hypothetical protein
VSAQDDYFLAIRQIDQGGMPVHVPIGVTIDGRGPADPATDPAFHHWACWCPDGEKCPVIFEMAWAALRSL